MASTAKKPNEMRQKSRLKCHKKAESFGNIKKITYFCISNNIAEFCLNYVIVTNFEMLCNNMPNLVAR